MRGKVEPFKGSMYQSRITPACAGKSISHYSKEGAYVDHPRVCGEKCTDVKMIAQNSGSPPRVRGKD